ncbi:RNA polymerase sigma-70 factor [Ruania zhangjianzhongii]|uniref:RNA polymerase sigma-70 factor n=1 Tax=Ruania zhangjianzhongii TaxID=2603206 RepID=UPI0011C83B12|nr:RNA polymerase sigma-70 factor [Ruania zhangjianzhongii]
MRGQGNGAAPGAGTKRAEEFTELRPLLFAIAYRILGSVTEAEDVVQDSWLRYDAAEARPESPKAYLSTIVTWLAVNVLKSARVRREEYVGEWFPEPLLEDPYQDPARSAELADSVSMAALVLLERLSPLERATFVLRDVFGFEYIDIAAAVGRSESACRQLLVRARRHVRQGRPRFEADREARDELAARFFEAIGNGDLDGLRDLLAADVQLVTDTGGKAPAPPRPIVGAKQNLRLLGAIIPDLDRIGLTLEPQEVNGEPGALARDGEGNIVQVMTLDIAGGRIQTIRMVSNPEKLAHLGPVADQWAVAREYRHGRDARR